MKNKNLGMLLITLIATSAFGMTTGAEELIPGVTVVADAESATGYTATFVYEAPEAEQVQVRGAFTFYNDIKEIRGVVPEEYATPEQWENGMFEAGDESLTIDMERVSGTDYWTTSMTLPSGHYQYVFLVDGDAETKLEDPTNPMEASGVENGKHYDRSTFYVPYDAEKQSESIDFTFMAPRTDGQEGQITYVNYTDINGNAAPLGIYIPYGYDAKREEPYKVLYLSHGGGGNETDWYAGGSVDYIFDNLIAEGNTEPVILVTMENATYNWMKGMDLVVENLVTCIMPYVEENYNVATEASGRAFAGLSQGGKATNNIMFDVPELFGYFGIFSGSDLYCDTTKVDFETLKNTKILLGGGIYDFGLVTEEFNPYKNGFGTVTELATVLDENGVSYGWEEVKGAHDWNTWPLLMKIFAEDWLWK